MEKKKFYTAYNHPETVGIDFTDVPSMTFTEYQAECDLNNIVDRNLHFKDPAYVTKMILAGKMSDKEPIYGDFTQVVDYKQALDIVHDAQYQFDMLPAKLRARFNNNPAEMLAFVNDPANVQEGIELGLYDAAKVTDDLISKENISAGNVSNLTEAGGDTVSVNAPETSA